MAEEGVSSVLGGVLMLSIMAMLVPAALMLKGALEDEMGAQAEAAERAAFCARNPGIGPPTCAPPAPMPGYSCTQVSGSNAFVCTPTNVSGAVGTTNATNTTSTTNTTNTTLGL